MSRRDGQQAPPLYELEAEVMEEMWRLGEATVRTVMDALNARADKERKYTTIMTTMRRLAALGLLARSRQGRSDLYTSTMSREGYRQTRTAAEVGALVDEYGDMALVHFARQIGSLDPKRREQLRRIARRD